MKEHDYSLSYRKLHDKDPIDYHARLARLGITCGFCNQVKNTSKAVSLHWDSVKVLK